MGGWAAGGSMDGFWSEPLPWMFFLGEPGIDLGAGGETFAKHT